MAYHDDEEKEKEKEPETLTDDALGEVLDEDADEETPVVPVEEDEKAWE